MASLIDTYIYIYICVCVFVVCLFVCYNVSYTIPKHTDTHMYNPGTKHGPFGYMNQCYTSVDPSLFLIYHINGCVENHPKEKELIGVNLIALM